MAEKMLHRLAAGRHIRPMPPLRRRYVAASPALPLNSAPNIPEPSRTKDGARTERPVDLNDILGKVRRRATRPPTYPGQRRAAVDAVKLAEAFVTNPCHETLKAFKQAEKVWLSYSDTPNAVSLSTQFTNALRSGNFIVSRNLINTASNTGQYHPHIGYVYGLTCMDRPGWIKLGSTTQHPSDRLEQFVKKYGLQEARLMFFVELRNPHEVERELQVRLRTRSVRQSATDSREWFELHPVDAVETLRRIIQQKSVEPLSRFYVYPKIAENVSVQNIWPTGYVDLYGRRARTRRTPHTK